MNNHKNLLTEKNSSQFRQTRNSLFSENYDWFGPFSANCKRVFEKTQSRNRFLFEKVIKTLNDMSLKNNS